MPPRRDLSISEASTSTGLSPDTLRYYEREGLIPRVVRSGGQRSYEPEVVAWIAFVAHLRATGMSVAQIRQITALAQSGDATLEQRRAALAEHHRAVRARIASLQGTLALIEDKLAYYDRRLATRAAPPAAG